VSEFIFTAEQGDNIEAGVYPARLSNVEVKQSKADGSDFRVWTFKAKVGDDIIDISGTTSMSNATNGKAFGWITAILGRQPQVGEKVTLDLLKGTTVNVVVMKDANGFSKVESLAPFGTKAKDDLGF
jgi:hypothetical protein